jgi:hypothetical protein
VVGLFASAEGGSTRCGHSGEGVREKTCTFFFRLANPCYTGLCGGVIIEEQRRAVGVLLGTLLIHLLKTWRGLVTVYLRRSLPGSEE